MKIAYIDNMNNFGFSVVRYLRDRGFDAELLILKHEYEHFKPESDTFNEAYKGYVKYLGWDEKGVFDPQQKKFGEALSQYQFILGAGYTPAYLKKAGMKLDVFVPHGSDFYNYPFKYENLNWSKTKVVQYFISNWQKKGIEESKHILLDITNDELESEFKKFNLKGTRIKKACPFIYSPQYKNGELEAYMEKSIHYNAFKKIRIENDLVVFHHCSHQWANPAFYYAQKRNDILINAFARFSIENPQLKTCLILFEYGPDVSESKKIIQSLGIEDKVKWFPKMFRKDIMVGISMCDIGAGEFGHSWFSYGVIYEFIALNKPVIHYREDEKYRADYPDMYPMFSAKNENEIINIFNQYKVDKHNFIETGILAGKWFEKYAINEPVDLLCSLIKNKTS